MIGELATTKDDERGCADTEGLAFAVSYFARWRRPRRLLHGSCIEIHLTDPVATAIEFIFEWVALEEEKETSRGSQCSRVTYFELTEKVPGASWYCKVSEAAANPQTAANLRRVKQAVRGKARQGKAGLHQTAPQQPQVINKILSQPTCILLHSTQPSPSLCHLTKLLPTKEAREAGWRQWRAWTWTAC